MALAWTIILLAPREVAMEKATFGAGCFWCTEAVFEGLHGVHRVVSGYCGGNVSNPGYRQVCGGATGHAEVVQIEFDPSVISYEQLLEVFFRSHDPTTLNRQGADIGSQYRSVIFTHGSAQEEAAKKMRARFSQRLAPRVVVTQIEVAPTFYIAEPEHQDYFARNPNQAYCQAVIAPKVEKLRQNFAPLMVIEN
jgi:peptide-methionine (S)-S-oxide reductase